MTAMAAPDKLRAAAVLASAVTAAALAAGAVPAFVLMTGLLAAPARAVDVGQLFALQIAHYTMSSLLRCSGAANWVYASPAAMDVDATAPPIATTEQI